MQVFMAVFLPRFAVAGCSVPLLSLRPEKAEEREKEAPARPQALCEACVKSRCANAPAGFIAASDA